MSISETTTQNDQTTARDALSRFVLDRTGRTTDELGFGWVGVAAAPSTYRQLRAAFHQSQCTGTQLPASQLHCTRTVFATPDTSDAFRFWHDTAHCRLGLSLELPDEWELALWHLDELRRAGFSTDSAEYQLLRVDLLGQLILLGVSGRFPFDQQDFTLTCGILGLDVGILTELRRRS